MTHTMLMVLVVGVLVIAIMVDVAAVESLKNEDEEPRRAVDTPGEARSRQFPQRCHPKEENHHE
jgi:hypothetical protein